MTAGKALMLLLTMGSPAFRSVMTDEEVAEAIAFGRANGWGFEECR